MLLLIYYSRALWRWLARQIHLGGLLLAYHPKSALVTEGWGHSFTKMQAINRTGEPIPWCTYSFLHFIETRLASPMRIFEFGCGNSTLYYAQRVSEIIAVEHDEQWAEVITTKLKPPSHVIYKPSGAAYIDEIKQHGLFDIVIVDGICRQETVNVILTALKHDGVIIWDNSDRFDFAAGYEVLKAHRFRELPFQGIAPITFVMSKTSILYRHPNCLGI
jgi:SAM-dependent methyltransferase